MVTLNDYREERLKKLTAIKQLGIDPYPAHSNRDTAIGDILADFSKFEHQTVTVAGRLVAIRAFGKIAFLKLRDQSGEIQLFLKADSQKTFDQNRTKTEQNSNSTPESAVNFTTLSNPKTPVDPNHLFDLSRLKLLDVGDFIEATGPIETTQTGEISIFTPAVRLLTKTLRPLPGRDGFTNKEARYRRRYVDLNLNPKVRARLIRRSVFWQATRDFMNANGFIEINTPVLETTTGGADAKPFITHLDALDTDFYLRISQELPLKRLLGGGFERVYDIGPRFRNEGVDDEHLPEHIAFEAYAAYKDYQFGMDFYENMIKTVAEKTWGSLQFSVNDFQIDLNQPWPRRRYADLIAENFKIDIFRPDRDRILNILHDNQVTLDNPDQLSDARLLDHLWKTYRRKAAGPFWLIEEPLALSPLAKTLPGDPRVVQRFHPIIAGTEMGNGYSELNDPLDQLARFEEQQQLRDAGDAEAQMLDRDFVEMLEYGMPPACGWGNSERNFWLLEGVSGREAVPFPIIRPEQR